MGTVIVNREELIQLFGEMIDELNGQRAIEAELARQPQGSFIETAANVIGYLDKISEYRHRFNAILEKGDTGGI